MPSKKVRNGKLVGWLAQVARKGVRRNKLCATKAEAKELEAKWTEEIERLSRMETHTVLEWANQYLTYSKARFSQKTYLEKHEAADLLVRVAGPQLEVVKLEVSTALKLLDTVAEKRSGYAANKVRKNLVAAWNWAVKHMDRWPQSKPNPFSAVEKYPYDKQQRQVPSMDDVRAVLDIMPEDDHAMLLCYLHTGARRDEVFRLSWQDVDFANSRITLWTRKRKSGSLEPDTIPMTSALREALLVQRGKSNGLGLVFRKADGSKYKYRRHWLPYWCSKAGVPTFTFHSIRHLTASWLDQHNVPLTTIQGILRHKSATTTAKYLHELAGTEVDMDEVFTQKQGRVVDIKKASGGDNTEGQG